MGLTAEDVDMHRTAALSDGSLVPKDINIIIACNHYNPLVTSDATGQKDLRCPTQTCTSIIISQLPPPLPPPNEKLLVSM